jgi:hypothetical protein
MWWRWTHWQWHSKSKSHYDWRSVSHSVSQYVLVSSPIRDFWPGIFFQSYCFVYLGHPLWREVGTVICQSVIAVYNSQSLFTTNIYIKLKIYIVLHTFTIFTIFTGLVQSRLCTADYALLTSNLVYHGSFRHLNSRTHDRRQIWASCIFCVGPRLVQCNEHFHFHDFGW